MGSVNIVVGPQSDLIWKIRRRRCTIIKVAPALYPNQERGDVDRERGLGDDSLAPGSTAGL